MCAPYLSASSTFIKSPAVPDRPQYPVRHIPGHAHRLRHAAHTILGFLARTFLAKFSPTRYVDALPPTAPIQQAELCRCATTLSPPWISASHLAQGASDRRTYTYDPDPFSGRRYIAILDSWIRRNTRFGSHIYVYMLRGFADIPGTPTSASPAGCSALCAGTTDLIHTFQQPSIFYV
ncbi:hypothetical protein D9611_011239 [Ephemerocybe angulata]|uniref:Uncharacterized protein n=1 Tax=Ephemerocybe angulata TaxID=980116 RepID=A0A8H5CCS8_9AGAR|nr:hypothetical protein D9611_011239 [Tulosesus angulatus]